MNSNALTDQFTTKARAVSALVETVHSWTEAFAYAVDVCDRKEACQLLPSGCEESLSEKAENACRKPEKIIAAPGLDQDKWSELAGLAGAKEIALSNGDDLRQRLSGIDVGFTPVQYGIAETGALVLDSRYESVRLATMISEVHIAVLPKSRIRPRAEDLVTELRELMGTPPGFLAFITGASRTADIERVLALGVHGPLELHVLLLEDE